jgi:hypothetical protein
LGRDSKEVSARSSLRTDDGEPEWMIGHAHDEAIDGRSAGADVLDACRQSLGVGWDETVARLMTGPDANAATDGGARATVAGAGDGHGAEWKSRREVGEAWER